MIEIYSNSNEIRIDGQPTGYHVAQRADRTVVYRSDGTEIKMPHPRYALSHNKPASHVPGRADFEADLRNTVGL